MSLLRVSKKLRTAQLNCRCSDRTYIKLDLYYPGGSQFPVSLLLVTACCGRRCREETCTHRACPTIELGAEGWVFNRRAVGGEGGDRGERVPNFIFDTED